MRKAILALAGAGLVTAGTLAAGIPVAQARPVAQAQSQNAFTYTVKGGGNTPFGPVSVHVGGPMRVISPGFIEPLGGGGVVTFNGVMSKVSGGYWNQSPGGFSICWNSKSGALIGCVYRPGSQLGTAQPSLLALRQPDGSFVNIPRPPLTMTIRATG
jgi:hypothetical protein